MLSKGYDLDISKNLLFLTAAMVIISSIWSLTVMTEDALAAPDKFGTDQLFIPQQMRMMMPLPGS